MAKIKSLEGLLRHRDQLKKSSAESEKIARPVGMISVKVAMATCSNAAGAVKVRDFLSEALEKRGIEANVTKVGCMGYCYAEPTIEVTLPEQEPVVFGDVDIQKADLIIEKYIKLGEPVDGIIPVNYRTIDEPINQ
jgi:NADP-reducing hydrogenase subunit HndB